MHHATRMEIPLKRSIGKRAYEILLNERATNEPFCDWLEFEGALRRESELQASCEGILTGESPWVMAPAEMYFQPKRRWVNRRLIFRPFPDAMVKFALTLPVAERLEQVMPRTSFANRRASGEDIDSFLLAPFAKEAWPRWVKWQNDAADEGHEFLLRKELTS